MCDHWMFQDSGELPFLAFLPHAPPLAACFTFREHLDPSSSYAHTPRPFSLQTEGSQPCSWGPEDGRTALCAKAAFSLPPLCPRTGAQCSVRCPSHNPRLYQTPGKQCNPQPIGILTLKISCVDKGTVRDPSEGMPF